MIDDRQRFLPAVLEITGIDDAKSDIEQARGKRWGRVAAKDRR